MPGRTTYRTRVPRRPSVYLVAALALGAVLALGAPGATDAAPASIAADPDSDGDGLSDFAELHKYRTDPAKADSDGDGVPDGDAAERREGTYSIRFVVRALPPATAIDDDRQDARVLARRDGVVELEIVVYPFADPDADIPHARERERAAAAMPERVSPTLTCDFDDPMRADLRAALKHDGIDPATLDDRDLVTRVAAWAMDRSEFESSGFCAQIVTDVGGRLGPVPGLEGEFRRRTEADDPTRTDRGQLEREVLGKEMFGRRRHGACTSSAIYLATILRALGVPTRQTLAMPPADASDPRQVAMLGRGIHAKDVRRPVLGAMRAMSHMNASHNFDLVFVGGRWRRLNYAELGPRYVDERYLGMLLRVVEFDELATSGIAETWGRHGAVGSSHAEFRGPNPYRLVAVDDLVGAHATVRPTLDEGEGPTPEEVAGRVVAREHEALTIDGVEWKRESDAAATLLVSRGEHVLVCRVKEWFGEQDGGQYQRFTERVDRGFEVVSGDGTRYPATARYGFEVSGRLHAVWVGVPVAATALMPRGAKLRLVPLQRSSLFRWNVDPEAGFESPSGS